MSYFRADTPLLDAVIAVSNYNDLLLVDGDIVAYRFSFLNEDTIDWGDGVSSELGNIEMAKSEARNFIQWLQRQTGCDGVLVFFTGKENFRKREFPDYKSNRKADTKPKMLDELKDAIASDWKSILRQGLEADDLMGMFSTHPALRDKCIIATIDKDLDQIAGWHYNWNHSKTYEVTPEGGNLYFWEQVLTGDTTDGYKGAHLIGKVKAKKLLDPLGSDLELWRATYQTYLKQGHDFAYLLSQARCAKMLQAEDYDWEKDEPVMWQPPMPQRNLKGHCAITAYFGGGGYAVRDADE